MTGRPGGPEKSGILAACLTSSLAMRYVRGIEMNNSNSVRAECCSICSSRMEKMEPIMLYKEAWLKQAKARGSGSP